MYAGFGLWALCVGWVSYTEKTWKPFFWFAVCPILLGLVLASIRTA